MAWARENSHYSLGQICQLMMKNSIVRATKTDDTLEIQILLWVMWLENRIEWIKLTLYPPRPLVVHRKFYFAFSFSIQFSREINSDYPHSNSFHYELSANPLKMLPSAFYHPKSHETFTREISFNAMWNTKYQYT